jgi:hypothetical protein
MIVLCDSVGCECSGYSRSSQCRGMLAVNDQAIVGVVNVGASCLKSS